MTDEQFEALKAWIYEVADDIERDWHRPVRCYTEVGREGA